MSFNLKSEVLRLIHDDKDIQVALSDHTLYFSCFSYSFTVQCLSEKMLEDMLGQPKFLDIAMRKVGARMQQEQVLVNLLWFLSLNVFIAQEVMLKAVEVQRETSDSIDSVTDDIDNLATRHGYPSEVSALVVDKFDAITMAYMQEHFRTTIPVNA